MRIAYFDCFAGISGDMILGSLVDAGLDVETLKGELAKLGLSEWDLKAERVKKQSIGGTKVTVMTSEKGEERHLEDITRLIGESSLDDEVKQLSKAVFLKLATAEANVHQSSVEKVHFHEVGAVDAIVDIVGGIVGVRVLGLEKIYASPLHLGTGFIESAHGTLPVPVPATVELVRDAPTYSRGIPSELVTPTGAALITTLAKGFGGMPPMKVERVGYGAGTKDLPIPNLLRVFIGEAWSVEDVEERHDHPHDHPHKHSREG